MLYFLTIAFGLLILLLIFFQLINEKRIQKTQIEKMFENLAIGVYRAQDKTNFDPDIYYDIISTSITCGRKTINQKHQIDLAIDTDDDSLKPTAAVITTVATRHGLEMSISCIDQPFIIVQHENTEKGYPEFEYTLNKEQRKKKIQKIINSGKDPALFENYEYSCKDYTDNFLGISLNNQKFGIDIDTFEISLKTGDKILLGNTLLKICKIQKT